MTVWFCPRCFTEVDPTQERCPACGAETSRHPDYEEALIRALGHPLPDRRRLTASILGRRRAVAAVPHLIAVANDPVDPYLAGDAAVALGRIGGPVAESALEELTRVARSFMVRGAAAQALATIRGASDVPSSGA